MHHRGAILHAIIVLAIVSGALVGCSTEGLVSDAEAPVVEPPAGPSYHADIAPILQGRTAA